MNEPKGRHPKITFFGNFGQGNLGNECTLQAILYNLRQHLPDAEVNCVCTGPQTAAKIHNIPAVPMRDEFGSSKAGPINPLRRIARKVLIGVPRELYRWLRAFRTLKGTDMLIVPGTQFLSDNLSGPLGWPYLAFKWSVIAKLRRCKLLFVGVGVGPLRHPLSRFFVKSSLRLADYRSFRDNNSRQYLHRIGFTPTNDPIYPDLAFSLPVPSVVPGRSGSQEVPVISVGVKDYHGQYGPSPLHKNRAGETYRKYLDIVAAFVAWLLEQRYTVRLIIGDVSYDPQVKADLRRSLICRNVSLEQAQVIDEPIESSEDLVSRLATSDIVVSPRFHNVVLAMLLGRPVIALSYHEKFAALMGGSELAEYNLLIDDLDSHRLIEQFLDLEKNANRLREHIPWKVGQYRAALNEQYKLIFGNFWR